jgi:hypothetical protein
MLAKLLQRVFHPCSNLVGLSRDAYAGRLQLAAPSRHVRRAPLDPVRLIDPHLERNAALIGIARLGMIRHSLSPLQQGMGDVLDARKVFANGKLLLNSHRQRGRKTPPQLALLAAQCKGGECR